jgi:retron-type reverse transcriptase
MASNLRKQVQSLRQLERAWHAIRDNARHSKSDEVRREVEVFAERASSRIQSLSHRLSRGRFKFEPAKGVPIPKIGSDGKKSRTKFRPIVLAPLESRIVQRSILETLIVHPAMEQYVYTPYSFGGVRRREDQEYAAVPAAVKAVLEAIETGARFVACADVRAFFTRISKLSVRDKVAEALQDDGFMKLFDEAIKVELSNLADLREKSELFPIHEIGVAQGNSLSPLLGNILMVRFDWDMNHGDCRCIRYIDDFIVLAPTEQAANSRMRRGVRILRSLGMELSPEKSSHGVRPVERPFEFLGIEFNSGFIRPSKKALQRLLDQIDDVLGASIAALRRHHDGAPFPKSEALINVLKRVDGIVMGWGKHYYFCNDRMLFDRVNSEISDRIRKYLGIYSGVRERVSDAESQFLLGVEKLGAPHRECFTWPRQLGTSAPKGSVPTVTPA